MLPDILVCARIGMYLVCATTDYCLIHVMCNTCTYMLLYPVAFPCTRVEILIHAHCVLIHATNAYVVILTMDMYQNMDIYQLMDMYQNWRSTNA